MTTTTKVSLTNAAYTEIAAGVYNCAIKPVGGASAIRVHIGASAPAAGTDVFWPVSSAPFSVSDLAGGDKVYARAEGLTASIIVIKG